MDQGDTFYTYGEQSRKTARVEKGNCPVCRMFSTLRSTPDATTDNNLDSLPSCK